MTKFLRQRTPAEKAARRRREKELAADVEQAARHLQDARGIHVPIARSRLLIAVRAIQQHHGLGL